MVLAPGKPANLTQTDLHCDGVSLTWNDPTENVQCVCGEEVDLIELPSMKEISGRTDIAYLRSKN